MESQSKKGSRQVTQRPWGLCVFIAMQILKLHPGGDMMPVIDRAVQVMRTGGTTVFPTDTLYGLGCNALDPQAVAKVFGIKHRSYMKALPMLVRDLSWARELVHITPEQERLISTFWPGKVTFILPRRDIVPSIMSGGGQTVGLRAPDHVFIQELLRHVGYPLAGTSADVATFAFSVPQPDLVIDAGPLPDSLPSTVVDLSDRQIRILRQGAVRADKILSFR